MKRLFLLILLLGNVILQSCSEEPIAPTIENKGSLFPDVDSIKNIVTIYSDQLFHRSSKTITFYNNNLVLGGQLLGDLGQINIGSIKLNFNNNNRGNPEHLIGYYKNWGQQDLEFDLLSKYFKDSISVSLAHPIYGFNFKGKVPNFSNVNFGTNVLDAPVSKTKGFTITWDVDSAAKNTTTYFQMFANDDSTELINPSPDNYPWLRKDIPETGSYFISPDDLAKCRVGMKLQIIVTRYGHIKDKLANGETAALLVYHNDNAFFKVAP